MAALEVAALCSDLCTVNVVCELGTSYMAALERWLHYAVT